MSYEHIIFDLDGTLIHSAPEIMSCLKKAFIKNGLDTELHTSDLLLRSKVGPPLEVMVQEISPSLSREDRDEVIQSFKEIYDQSNYLETQVYPGVFEVLSYLEKNQKFSYIATNKRNYPTCRVLSIKNLGPFRDTLSIDSLPQKKLTKAEMLKLLLEKWRLERDTVLMVGDTAGDMLAATHCKIDSVAFLGGYGSESELLKCQPKFIAKNILEVIDFVL